MKSYRQEKKLCACCHDKPAIYFRHGYDDVHKNHGDGHDLCPRCWRDLQNSVYADMMVQQAKVFVLDNFRPMRAFETDAVPVAAVA